MLLHIHMRDALMRNDTSVNNSVMQLYNIMLQKSRYKNNSQLLSFSGPAELIVLKRLGIKPLLHNITINIL